MLNHKVGIEPVADIDWNRGLWSWIVNLQGKGKFLSRGYHWNKTIILCAPAGNTSDGRLRGGSGSDTLYIHLGVNH